MEVSSAYTYLVGLCILLVVWLVLFVYRKDMRNAMVWSGLAYVAVLSVGFLILKVGFGDIPDHRAIIPGYWNPNTLFDLGRRTGGYAIEDAIYMFLTGGIASAIYEELFGRRIRHKHKRHRPHIAVLVGAIAGFLVVLTDLNLIYAMLAFAFVGTTVIWIQRPDLIKHSLWGGGAYFVVYVASFLLFLELFPDYIHLYYGLDNLTGILALGIPLEELLFAFSFGTMWSPIYEYVKDV